jgi:O-antigen/teichoic acid export membrane protein
VNKSSEGLRSRLIHAGIWSSLAGFAATGLRFASSLVLTRLLVPEVFGLVAVAMVLYLVIALVSDIGIRQAVVYGVRGEEQEFLDTVWSLCAVRGLIIAAISGLVAIGFWTFSASGLFPQNSVYAHENFPLVFFLTAATALIVGFKSPKMLLLERRLEFKRLAILELFSQIGGAVVTIALAWVWRSVWPIIVGTYVSSVLIVYFSIFHIKGPIGHFKWDQRVVKEVFEYGRWILLASLAFVLATNADRILLGIWVIPAMLGFYVLALNILQAVEQIISRPFTSAGMSALSEVARRDASRVKEAYLRVRMPYDAALLGAAGFFAASGQLIVDVLYDPRYAQAGWTLQALSPFLFFQRYNLAASAHIALGDSKSGFHFNLIKLISIFIAVPLGYSLMGYEGAVWGIALHMLPSAIQALIRNQRHRLNDFKFEVTILLALPLGWLFGWLIVRLGFVVGLT